MPAMKTLNVDLGSRSYPIHVGGGLLSEPELLRPYLHGQRLVVVSNETVAPLHGERLRALLAGHDFTWIDLPDGERYKTLATVESVLTRMLQARFDRGTTLIAFGGGVVGDIAGFAAAIYQRGIDFIQVPTTLLSQVDSSVGGKTGVDLAAGKNLAGAFKQPSLVLADVSVLATLPGTEWTSGLAEVAKVAMLESREMVDVLIAEAPALLGRDEQPVVDVVLAAVRHKAAVVAADEREAGERESLNYGHTLGHAIEQVAGYGAVPHGIAVAEGMRFAALLAEVVVGAPEQTRVLQDQLLDALGIERPTYPRDARRLLDAMHADKKARSGTVRYVFVPEPGRHVVVPVDDATIAHVLDLWFDGESERG